MIGLLGGTSWSSTIEYYRILNQLAQEKLGGYHSANLLLRSIDYHDMKSLYMMGGVRFPRDNLCFCDQILVAECSKHKCYLY